MWSIFDQAIGNHCALCHTRADGLCQRCREALPRNLLPCGRCALPLPAGAAPGSLCAACQAESPGYDRVIAPLLYQAPVSDLVARFKYHARLDLGRILASELRVAVSDSRPALLLPVPMDPSGLRRRGYNQAGELARWLSAQLGIPWSAGHLARVRGAAHQRELDRAQRRRNLRGVFSCRDRLPEHVAVVDDVVTTGATVNEISATLRRAGAQEIEIWAVARTPARHGR